MKYFLVILSILISSFGFTQTKNYEFKTFTALELKQDLEVFRNKLDSCHFNAYHKHTKQEFDEMFEKIISSINKPMNTFEFYWNILPVFNMLEDAHSWQLFPFRYNKKYSEQGGKYIPLSFEIQEEEIYIKENYSTQKIPLYSKIESINDVSKDDILKQLSLLINAERSEGESNYMAHFLKRVLFPLYGFDEYFEIIIITPDNQKMSIKVEGIPLDKFPLMSTKNYELKYESKIAIMDINRCEDKENFEPFCDSVFNDLSKNKIQNLVIDLRDNPGGSTFHGDILLSYLSNQNFPQFAKREIKHAPSIDGSQKVYTEESIPDTLISTKKKFNGNVFIIVNEGTYSSASVMAATFKCYDIAKLVGQETGGVEVFYDEPLMYSLPNTKLQFLLSHQKYHTPCGKSMNLGIIPDYEVEWNLNDHINGIDTEFEFIKNHCN